MTNYRFLAALVLASWGLAGCPGPSADLSTREGVSLTTVPSEDFYFEWARVYQQDKTTRIEGRVRGKRRGALTPGHVDAAVIGSNGELLAMGSGNLNRRRHRNHGHSEYSFIISLAIPLPAHSEVRLSLHSPEGRSDLHCEDNQAEASGKSSP